MSKYFQLRWLRPRSPVYVLNFLLRTSHPLRSKKSVYADSTKKMEIHSILRKNTMKNIFFKYRYILFSRLVLLDRLYYFIYKYMSNFSENDFNYRNHFISIDSKFEKFSHKNDFPILEISCNKNLPKIS